MHVNEPRAEALTSAPVAATQRPEIGEKSSVLPAERV
jgi:hypothetical protein